MVIQMGHITDNLGQEWEIVPTFDHDMQEWIAVLRYVDTDEPGEAIQTKETQE